MTKKKEAIIRIVQQIADAAKKTRRAATRVALGTKAHTINRATETEAKMLAEAATRTERAAKHTDTLASYALTLVWQPHIQIQNSKKKRKEEK